MSYQSLVFTTAVKELQKRYGSEKRERSADTKDLLGEAEANFIAGRDSFYLATRSETGWPYVQHRGGPKGFLHVLDNETLAFADFRGNRQYVSAGNLLVDDRAALILVDYPRRARLKLLGRANVVEAKNAGALLESVQLPGYAATVERIFVLKVEGLDWNCPQHITPRYTEEEIRVMVGKIEIQTDKLKRENEKLRAELAQLRATARLGSE